jgi:hypothetical protein
MKHNRLTDLISLIITIMFKEMGQIIEKSNGAVY